MIVEQGARAVELERLTDALPAGVVYARGGIVHYCNRTLAEWLGAAPRSLVGRSLFDVVAPEHADVFRRRFDERDRGMRVPDFWEVELVRDDGERVRVAVEPQTIGSDELVILARPLGRELRALELANHLTRLALRVQRERSVDGMLAAAAAGLHAIGFTMYAWELDGDAAVIRAVPPDSPFVRAWETACGRPLLGARIDRTGMRDLDEQFGDGGVVFFEDTAPLIERIARPFFPPETAAALAAVAVRSAVLAPIFLGGRRWGGLFIGSHSLASRDAGSVALFGAQLASAMEIARTIEELDCANRNLRAIQDENQRLIRETTRRYELLSVQHALSRAIAGWLEEGPLADRALELLVERLGIDAAWIYVDRDGRLERIACRVPPDRDPAAIPAHLERDESSVCGHCAAERRAFEVDLHADEAIASPPGRALGMRHLFAVPLLVEERLVGALAVARARTEGFDLEEKQLVESSAVQLAVALEHSRLFAEQRRRVQDLSLLNELGDLFSQHIELPALLSIGVERVTRLVDLPQVFLSLLEPGGQTLRVVASNLREPGVLDLATPRDGPSAAAVAVRELRPVLIENALEDPRASRDLALRFGHHAVFAAPLISRGEPIGALVLCETRAGRRIDSDAIVRAIAVANQLAAAIANARLFSEERERVRELSLLSELGRIASGTLQREVLLTECLGHIRSALGFDAGAAWIARRGKLELTATSDDGDGGAERATEFEPLARRALEAAAPIAEAVGDRHGCAVPLLAGPDASGVLAFVRSDRPVGEAELRTLAAAAPELGVALQNARLFDEASRRVEELRLLLDIGRAITGSLDLDATLETSAGILSRFIDGSNAFILLLDPASGELRGAACSNPTWRESFRSMRIPLDEPSIAAHSVRTRAPVAVNDVTRSIYAGSERIRLFGEKSVLAVPLLVREEPIGCVLVDDTRQTREWSAAEIERVTLIAHQVAVSVANAHLYHDLKRSYGELARTQEELVKRERLAALGELAAVVAHEVRNPLGVIFNSLGSLRRLLKPTGDAKMLLEIVAEEADRLDRIVRDLLDFARPNEPTLEAERLDRMLADVVQAAQGDQVPEGVRVEMEVAPDLPEVRIDARMIRQVLLNLVLNGLQAMQRGGTLRIRASLETSGDRWIRIDFADEGPGVPPELAPRIFQPFFTTKATGTGLGLAVVKRFVDAHRGTIDFRSRPGEGTTFTLRLPVQAGP